MHYQSHGDKPEENRKKWSALANEQMTIQWSGQYLTWQRVVPPLYSDANITQIFT